MFVVAQELGDQIRELRERLGRLTQKELAERIGVERATLAQWERGAAKPRAADLDRLEALGLGQDPAEWGFMLRLRASPNQLKILIDTVAEEKVPYQLREQARQELLRVLSLDEEPT